MPRPELHIDAAQFRKLIHAGDWAELKSLRLLLGEDTDSAKVIGYAKSAEYAFLAVDVSPAFQGVASDVKRSLVLLKDKALVCFDLITSAGEPAPFVWRLTEPKGTVHSAVSHKNRFLNILQTSASPVVDITTIDLAGVRIGDWALLFHDEPVTARSAVSFVVDASTPMKYLVTGLTPGGWEVWCNGWLIETGLPVDRLSCSLYLEGTPGSYFLRRLS